MTNSRWRYVEELTGLSIPIMFYKEIQAPTYLSKHIETYWEMQFFPGALAGIVELLFPSCTFNMVFADQAFRVKSQIKQHWTKIHPGATFIGQSNNCISFSIKKPIRIFGVRFKPFAFANIIKTPIHLLSDQFLPVNRLFNLDITKELYIRKIINCQELEQKTELVNTLMLVLLENSFSIDEILRAQLNYILDRKGLIKINELFSEFGISKVTLRKHFLNKVGLTPKKVARIWRINYFLHLKESLPAEKLTTLCLMSGFYDQAHFIKEFKLFSGTTPLDFFKSNHLLLKVAKESNWRRFTNQYDPR